ncbi:Cyclic AMP receptor protein [Fundidesulfovibrio magnetotacticus]|uniref:Cyclic AMP receptor protein n=1 Tax=Fundidesulfovibrio magnetotacticus TaxID=2730080 RepID=A0A6V8LWG6_9BACT|nr:cyclic nucleotide-binding domain-containing protein [Fundidesulfovibrio magnetotacticus]GFK94618.1 Cyclic AMP receptor protein [Fundidesulfovibrio magnetotacticus]
MSGFEGISLFADLDPGEIEAVRPLFTRREVPAATRIIAEGETGSEMFVLVAGSVRVVKSMVLPGIAPEALAGKEPSKVLAHLTGDDAPFFGEMGLVSDAPRSATVETQEPCIFLVTDRERLFKLVRARPETGCKLLAALCGRLAHMVRTSNAEVVKLTTALAILLAGRS